MPCFIYSTLTAPQQYTVYQDGPVNDGLKTKVKVAHVFVGGGANVSNKHFVTPLGAVTEVSEDELQLLRGNWCFNDHVKNGFITVQETGKKMDVEEVVKSDMKPKDKSAPLTKKDMEDKNKKDGNDVEVHLNKK